MLAGVEQTPWSPATRTCSSSAGRAMRCSSTPAASGWPYEGEPGAYWALARRRCGRAPAHRLRPRARGRARARSGHPQAEEFATENVLRRAVARRGARGRSVAERARPDRPRRASRTGSTARSSSSTRARTRRASPSARRCVVDGEPAKVVGSKRSRGRPVIRLDRDVPRGAELAVPRAELPPPGEDEYYVFQLVGLEVEEEGGRALGRVAARPARSRERRARARLGRAAAARRRVRAAGRPRGAAESSSRRASPSSS